MRTGARRGPSNRLVLYLGETTGVQPAMTRRLTLDFISCYRFSPYYIHLTYRNFICQHSTIIETTVKQRPLAFILFDFQYWESLHQCYFSAVNTYYVRPPGTRDTYSLFHILTSFVRVGPISMLTNRGCIMGCEL